MVLWATRRAHGSAPTTDGASHYWRRRSGMGGDWIGCCNCRDDMRMHCCDKCLWVLPSARAVGHIEDTLHYCTNPYDVNTRRQLPLGHARMRTRQDSIE